MQGTKLMLINLNKYTLLRRYKNSSRRDEIRLLDHASSYSPPARTLCHGYTQVLPASSPAPPEGSHMFEEAPDQTGKARVRDTSSVVIHPCSPPAEHHGYHSYCTNSTSVTLVVTTSATLVATTSATLATIYHLQ
jgi:hypothetical protein